jgi:oligopeptide transport system permease protein
MSHGGFGERAQRLAATRDVPFAAAVVVALIVLALAGPLLCPPATLGMDWRHVANAPALTGPHWLGTDRLGRDLLARTLAGARVSLALGAVASTLSVAIGLAYGAVAGYLGGRTDALMMRLLEILSGLPLLFFVIFVTVLFGHGESTLFVSIGAVGWLTLARIVRGETLSLRRREFIEAAIAVGAGTPRILWRHVLPNVAGTVIVYATLAVPQIMLLESFLSFLGLGIGEPRASLGTLIAEGAGELESAPWMLLVPGGYLAALLLALNLLGDGLRDALADGGRG